MQPYDRTLFLYWQLQEVERIDGLLARHRDFQGAFLANAAMWNHQSLESHYRDFQTTLRRNPHIPPQRFTRQELVEAAYDIARRHHKKKPVS